MKRLTGLLPSICILGFLLAGAGGAQADAPGLQPLRKAPLVSEPAAPTPPVLGWGDANPGCAEWTNACLICKRNEAGVAACSTPGIACQPQAISCSRQVEPKK